MARPKRIVESTPDFADDVKSIPEFKITRIYDPTSIITREIDAYSQDELERLLAGGWLIKAE
jgi:hypothetical protein